MRVSVGSRVILGGIVLLTSLLLWYFLSPNSSEQSKNPASKIEQFGTVAPTSDREMFLGNKACLPCHAEIAAHYERSPMAHSWKTVDGPLLENLNFPGQVKDAEGVYQYEVFLQNGRLCQKETVVNDETGHRLIAQAAYAVGSGNHATALVAENNGYLTQLPVGWFSREGDWKFNPGYELRNQRFARPITPGCMACHGGFAAPQPFTRNRYVLPVSNGIRCEQCHGPGKAHVEYRETHVGTSLPNHPDPIVNPARLSPARANDVCLQCHLQGDVTVYFNNADPFRFRPGNKLVDHRLDYLVKTDQPETFGVASHGSRIQHSKCFQQSEGKLTCIVCHDPHRPVSDFSPATYNSQCAICHERNDCSRPSQVPNSKQSANCIHCHMPQRKTQEGQHLVFTDHWIRSPANNDQPIGASPLLSSNADIELIPIHPEPPLDGPGSLGMAYVKLHMTMGPQKPSLAKGVSLLKSAATRKPVNRQILYWLATGLVAQYRSAEAIPYLKEILAAQPGWTQARFRLAVAYHQLHLYGQAISEYERVIQQAPDWMAPYPLLVRIYLVRKDARAAIRLLHRQISFQPDETAHLNLALAFYLNGRPLADSLEQIASTIRLNPKNPAAYSTRAYLHRQSGDSKAARKDYQTALKIDPNHKEAQAGLRALKSMD